jgi:hypothetical protein
VSRPFFFLFLLSLITIIKAQTSLPCTEASNRAYSVEEKSYFAEVALGTEYGDTQVNIHKWLAGTTVGLRGNFTPQDARYIQGVLTEINTIVGGRLLEFVDDTPDITIHLLPQIKFGTYEPNYVPGNAGFFWFYWSANQDLYKATLLVDDRLELPWRKHMFRELLTRTLGLANNSFRYEESIFGKPVTPTNRYLPIDRTVIKMLYRCDVVSGMGYDELPAVVKRRDKFFQ